VGALPAVLKSNVRLGAQSRPENQIAQAKSDPKKTARERQSRTPERRDNCIAIIGHRL
jgi:hypothetical protein